MYDELFGVKHELYELDEFLFPVLLVKFVLFVFWSVEINIWIKRISCVCEISKIKCKFARYYT